MNELEDKHCLQKNIYAESRINAEILQETTGMEQPDRRIDS